MADPFVAEIRVVAFNFPPKGWAFCNGQLLPLSQNTALFSLLGTMYGGNGKSNFALPDIQGSAVIFYGQGPGLSYYDQGEISGSQNVTLLQSEMPIHNHGLMGANPPASLNQAAPNVGFSRASGGSPYKAAPTAPVQQMALQALAPSGGNQPHNNMMPSLTMNYIIALQGVFPPRG
jgi:microcystin-dependent protein